MEEFRELCFCSPKRCVRVLEEECYRKHKTKKKAEITVETISAGLKRLKIAKRSSRTVIAERVTKLLVKSSVEEKYKFQKLVQYFRKVRFELALLKLLQQRVSGRETFAELRENLTEKDAFYEGCVSVALFNQALDTLGLDLKDEEKLAIARPFLKSDKEKRAGIDSKSTINSPEPHTDEDRTQRVNYETFLAVVNPELSIRSESSSSSSISSPHSAFGDSSSAPSSLSSVPRSTFGDSEHGKNNPDDILTVLDNLRSRILTAQSNGVSARESFEFFDMDRNGVVNREEFEQALRNLDVNLSGPILERVLYVFHGHDDNDTIDYVQFLRFLDKDYDSVGFFSREGVDSPDRPTEAIPYHDVVKSGPFVAGFTDSKPRNDHLKTVQEEEDIGVFVRHSYTSAGYVRQVIAPKNGQAKVENHCVIRHSQKGGEVRYSGVLESKEQKEETLSLKEKRRLVNATKTNSIVKYLGYAAEVCNDYPRIEKKSQRVNTVLVRNFKQGAKEKSKGRTSSSSSTNNKKKAKEGVEEIQPTEARVFSVQKRVHSLQEKHSFETLGTTSANNCYSSKLVESQTQLVKLLTASVQQSHPTLLSALKSHRKCATPSKRVLYEQIKLSQSLNASEDFPAARKQLDQVFYILRELHRSGIAQGLKKKKGKKKKASRKTESKEQEENDPSDIPASCGRFTLDDDSFSFATVREAFENAKLKSDDTIVPLDKFCSAIAAQCFLGDVDCPLSKLKEGLEMDTVVTDYFQGIVGRDVEDVSWLQVMETFRLQDEDEFLEFTRGLEDWFTLSELSSLKSAFSKCKPIVELADAEDLIRAIQLDCVLKETVLDNDALEKELLRLDEVSYEEFLIVFRDYCKDFSQRELYIFALQTLGESHFLESVRNRDRINRSALKHATSHLNQALEERLDVCNHDEWHPSLAEIYSIISELRQVEAAVENTAKDAKLKELVDKYLCSRSGINAVETIVSNMLKQDKVANKVGTVSRERAELAARAMLRKKKTAELTRKDMVTVIKIRREEAADYGRKSISLYETTFGHDSVLCTLANFRLALLFQRLGEWFDASEHLSVVLHNVLELKGKYFETTGRVAKLLATFYEKQLNFEKAAMNYQISAECVDRNVDDVASLSLWRTTLKCFNEMSGEHDEQSQIAAGRIVDILGLMASESSESEQQSRTANNELVDGLFEYGEILVRVGDLSEAKAQFRRAKSLILRTNPVLSPLKRKQVCKLNRLIASVSTSSQLIGAMKDDGDASEEKIDENADFLKD